MASRVDHLFYYLVSVSVFFVVLIAGAIMVFMVRYRRGSAVPRGGAHLSMALEAGWMVVPLVVAMVAFVWGATLYAALVRAPDDALVVHVVGKQWMWKVQHLEGRREINELHIPTGRPVRLILTSEDVIHSFYVPAFRTKQDAVPGRYTSTWFQATRAGRYHLFCAEYCGTIHSGMIGSVVAMEPAAFEAWLAGAEAGESAVAAGERIFEQNGCASCHASGSGARGPALAGLAGTTVLLVGGGSVTADETYLRESIVNPTAKVVAGYEPIMPTFQGLIGEEDLMRLIAYITSLPGAKRAEER